ncbi:MAG: hypothetical protein WBG86_23040 [Polyangiales bacterium]
MSGSRAKLAVFGGALLVCFVIAYVIANRRSATETSVVETNTRETRAKQPVRPEQAPGDLEFEEPDIEIPPDSVLTAPHFDLANLDYDALREKTPDSLYWLLAAPTDDPKVLEARRAENERRNQQFGRVSSNTASVDEINDYFAYRRRLSEDYVEVAQLILDTHGDDLSERDVGLFELTVSLHGSRLAELPNKLDDALRRKAEYDEVKRAWQAQQEAEREGGEPRHK